MIYGTQETSDGIEPDAVNVYTSCRTVGCKNEGVSVLVTELYGSMLCGVCSTEISDITDIAPESPPLPEEVPPWL